MKLSLTQRPKKKKNKSYTKAEPIKYRDRSTANSLVLNMCSEVEFFTLNGREFQQSTDL